MAVDLELTAKIKPPRPVGLLLGQARSAGGAVGMAELTDIRETIRKKYTAAARAAAQPNPPATQSGCCGVENVESSRAISRTFHSQTRASTW